MEEKNKDDEKERRMVLGLTGGRKKWMLENSDWATLKIIQSSMWHHGMIVVSTAANLHGNHLVKYSGTGQ